MTTDVSNQRVIVVVFVQEGCPACDDFKPRFDRLAERYVRAGLPIFVYNAASDDTALSSWMDQLKVEGTPTLLVLKRGPSRPLRIDGAVPDDEIETALRSAYRVHLGR